MAGSPSVVIVGASLAGLRTAEAVLAALPGARVTLVGEETRVPYNRPPLSKDAAEALAGDTDACAQAEAFGKLVLRSRLPDGAIAMRLGLRAVGVDAGARRVALSDGTVLGYDWLVAATGLRPRRLPMPGADARRHVLRSFDDAVRLGGAMQPGHRMIVVGGGFIGCEIAATATKLGLSATIVEPAAQPMLAALGAEVAAAMAALHRRHGVAVLTGTGLSGIAPTETGVAVTLADGRGLAGDLLVEAIGSLPNVEWLEGAGLDLSNGILCAGDMRAAGNDRILAVGDVARFANPLFGPAPRRVEHWCVPGQTAKRAADTIAAAEAGAAPASPFAPMPSFWSDQYGLRLQGFGAPGLADQMRVIEGDLALIGAQPCLVEYLRGGRMIGLVGLGASPAQIAPHRARLDRALAEPAAA